jgi:Outer membrane protein beta-barrel domain
MQYVDNDMDDLFRKAAEHYPLRIPGKSWDDITPYVQPIIPVEGKNKRKFVIKLALAAMLFLTLGFVILVRYETLLTNKTIAVDKTNNLLNTKNHALPVLNTVTRQKPVMLNPLKLPHAGHRINKINRLTDGFLPATMASQSAQTYNRPLYGKKDLVLMPVSKMNYVISVGRPLPGITGANYVVPDLTYKRVTKGRALFISLLAGLQANQVEGQGFSKTGLSAGVVAGYRWGRIGLETGLIWSNKHFQSGAQYFDMLKAGAGMPASMVVKSINSTSSMFELPVMASYRIRKSRNTSWLLKAGVSSYIYTHESNGYAVLDNGQSKNVYARYNSHTPYFSAVAQLSAGYEYTIRQHTDISVAPYCQIPLKGIGIGNVQLMTLGIHIGISRFIPH